MTWTFCTSGAAINKAGANANSTIVASGAALTNWCDEAEAFICSEARVDLVTDYSNLTANGKHILQQLCSDIIGQQIVGYDMGGYVDRREAETILDILENRIRRNISLITNDNIKTYLGAT